MQSQNDELIQFSGYTLASEGDSIEPAAFILIKNKSRNSGSYSNPSGFFSLVVQRGDTVVFSCVGFKKGELIIPQTLRSNKFTANQIMVRETMRLRETVIVPWRDINELKQAFLDLQVNEDDLVIAYQNLQYDRWQTLSASMPLSANESQRMMLNNQNQNNLLQSGITPMNNLLNPLAWYQFINMLSNTKNKKKQSISEYKYSE